MVGKKPVGKKLVDKKLVLKLLGQNKNMPSTIPISSIVMKTGAHIGEVKDALNQLEDEGLVKSRTEYFYLTRAGLKKAIDLEKE